jgi:hypothetical protein
LIAVIDSYSGSASTGNDRSCTASVTTWLDQLPQAEWQHYQLTDRDLSGIGAELGGSSDSIAASDRRQRG